MTRTAESSSLPSWTATDLAADPHQFGDKPERVRRMFTSIARRYDLNNRLHSLGRDQAWRRAAVRAAAVIPATDVLDVACGTGDLTLAFARAGAHSVVGLDYTPAMLDIARQKWSGAQRRIRPIGDTPQVSFVEGDAMDLSYPDASFDVVSIAFGLRNVADPARAVGEFRRVLRPGGRLVILEFCDPCFAPIRWLNRLYCGLIMPVTASLIARDRSGAYWYLPRSVGTFMDPPALAQLVERAGFCEVQTTRMTFGICAVTVGTLC